MGSEAESARQRAARVRITYEVEQGAAVEKREIPFVVGILADLSGNAMDRQQPRLKDRRFTGIDLDNFDRVLTNAAPRLALKVDCTLSYEPCMLAVELLFKSMEDFQPQNIARQVQPLRKLVDRRTNLVNLRSRIHGNQQLEQLLFECLSDVDRLNGIWNLTRDESVSEFAADTDYSGRSGAAGPALMSTSAPDVEQHGDKESDILERIIATGNLTGLPKERETLREGLSAFLREAADGNVTPSRNVESAITSQIAAIDRLLSMQIGEILHHPEFQALEATWRGIYYLVSQTQTSPWLKIRVLNASKKDLYKDVTRAAEFDQTGLFRKIYEEEYGVFGGIPFGVLVGDYYFDASPQDLELLAGIADVAAAAHTPFISGVSPRMFYFERFTELAGPRDLSTIFDNTAFLGWKCFRDSEASRYVGLVLPHILLRLPYGQDTNPLEAFRFEENVDGSDHTKYLWGNAAFAFAARVNAAFAAYSWCAEILGVERGGLVRQLPLHEFTSEEGDVVKCPTEIPISDRRLAELTTLGFIALCHAKDRDYAAFFWAPSCNRAPTFWEDEANAKARIHARIDYMFTLCRFTHYVKVILRERVHAFKTPEECHSYLSAWLKQYVAPPDAEDLETLAHSPLAQASVTVAEMPGKPGVYAVTLSLMPQFQFAVGPEQLRWTVRIPGAREPVLDGDGFRRL